MFRFPFWWRELRHVGMVFALAHSIAASGQSSPPVVPQDLKTRLQAAAAAQQSGDPAAVEEASRGVLALALRQMCGLRASLGLFDASEALCKRSLDFEESADTRFSLAITYTGAGQLDEGLEQVDKVIATDSNNAAAWNLQGKLWMMKKEYAKAADSLAKSLALQNDPEAAYTMATALLKTNQVEKAAAVFHQLQVASGDRAEGYILAARAYEAANLPAEAEREYNKAIALDAKASRGHYFLGLFYLVKNGWDPTPQAREEFLAEVAVNPTDFFGNYFMGYLTFLEKHYEESDRYMAVAAKARPDWPEPYLYMGLNAYGAGLSARAETLLRKAIQLTGSDEGRNNYQIRRALVPLGRILINRGEREEGTKYLVRSRDIENKLMDNNRQQALADEQAAPGAELHNLSVESEKTSAAKQGEDAAVPLDPDAWQRLDASERTQAQESEHALRTVLANAYNDLATSQARRRDYEVALVHFQDAQRWDPEIPGLMRNLGLAAFFSKHYAESARALKIVVKNDPSDRRAVSMLALSLYSINDFGQAAKVFDQVQDETLADPRMTYAWATSLVRTNDKQGAATVLAKLVAMPIPPGMLALAGKLYADMGEQKSAAECYRRAKEQDPNVVVPK